MQYLKQHPLTYQAIGAIPWAIFFAVSPIELIFFSSPIWAMLIFDRERARTKKYGFLKGAVLRLLIFSLIISFVIWLPFKFEDQKVQLPEGSKLSLVQLRNLAFTQGVGLSFRPDEIEGKEIYIPDGKMSVREILNEIETQTGERFRIGYCGNESSFLYGSSPMGITLVKINK